MGITHNCFQQIDKLEAHKLPTLGMIKLFEVRLLSFFSLPVYYYLFIYIFFIFIYTHINNLGFWLSFQAFYAFSKDALIHKDVFRGGLD